MTDHHCSTEQQRQRLGHNARQRQKRKSDGNAATHRYEKTKNGFLMRLYRNMQSRITGVLKSKHHLYDGKYLLPREDFVLWAMDSWQFHRLFKEWEMSGYERRLTPSVDRINPEFGYDPSNMEWVPFHENCRRGGKAKRK